MKVNDQINGTCSTQRVVIDVYSSLTGAPQMELLLPKARRTSEEYLAKNAR